MIRSMFPPDEEAKDWFAFLPTWVHTARDVDGRSICSEAGEWVWWVHLSVHYTDDLFEELDDDYWLYGPLRWLTEYVDKPQG